MAGWRARLLPLRTHQPRETGTLIHCRPHQWQVCMRKCPYRSVYIESFQGEVVDLGSTTRFHSLARAEKVELWRATRDLTVPFACNACGVTLERKDRDHCDDCCRRKCVPVRRRTVNRGGRDSRHCGGAGEDPAHFKAANRRCGITVARRQREVHQWEVAHRGETAPERFRREILSGLQQVSMEPNVGGDRSDRGLLFLRTTWAQSAASAALADSAASGGGFVRGDRRHRLTEMTNWAASQGNLLGEHAALNVAAITAVSFSGLHQISSCPV